MIEIIDRKFALHVVCREHGHTYTEADAMVFLAKDQALPATLDFYRKECERRGVAERQLRGIDRLIERVERWQEEHPEQLKVADVDDGKIGDYIIGPNEPPAIASPA